MILCSLSLISTIYNQHFSGDVLGSTELLMDDEYDEDDDFEFDESEEELYVSLLISNLRD